MGKNSDTSNIFSSYMDNVLLKEAVRSVDSSSGAPSAEKRKTAQERLKLHRALELTAQAHGLTLPYNNNGEIPDLQTLNKIKDDFKKQIVDKTNAAGQQLQQQGKTQGTVDGRQVNVNPDGSVTSSFKGNVKPNSQITQQPTTVQPSAPAPVTQQPTTQPAPQAAPAPQPEADDESGYEEVETTQETIPANVQAQPLVTADDGTSYTKDEMDDLLNNLKEFDKTLKPVSEHKNIAKFLKCLSEKNYSKANKYLNVVVQNKLKNLFLEEIE
jgi:hypothetical protein